MLRWDNRARWDMAVPRCHKRLLPNGSVFRAFLHGLATRAWGSRVSFELGDSTGAHPCPPPLSLKNSMVSARLKPPSAGGTWLAAPLHETGHRGILCES